MKIVFAYPPGRFPTVVHDPGACWEQLSGTKDLSCEYFNGNLEWWQLFCSPRFIELFSGKFPLQELVSGKLGGKFTLANLAKIAVSAGETLKLLQAESAFTSVDRYSKALEPLSNYVRLINYLQPGLGVKYDIGPEVNGVDYTNSRAMVEYAGKETLLSTSIDRTLASLPEKVDACLLSVTSSYDLLTCLILAERLRRRYPGIYLSIISHGYENSSLDSQSEKLEKTGALFEILDSIVKFSYQKNAAVSYLVSELKSGRRPKGFIELSAQPLVLEPSGEALPRQEAFSPEPLFSMRISDKKCYWSQCAFCVQNARHEEGPTPSEQDVDLSLLRVEKLIKAGYKYFYFGDEALHPRLLEYLCRVVASKNMVFRWACRCRMEPPYDEDFFIRLKAAGCYEVLFGVESLVPRVQRLMRKYQDTVTEQDVRSVIDRVASAGLGIHLTFIVGFPGERLDETKTTLMFLAKALKNIRHATYYVNTFTLFHLSAVFRNPDDFGITAGLVPGDIGSSCGYSFRESAQAEEDQKIRDALPELLTHVGKELGWAKFENRPETKLLRDLYFNYGHGAYIKSSEPDIFTTS